MSEVKDPKIKLFGKTIELPDNSSSSAAADESGVPGSVRSYEHATGDGSNHDPPCSSNSMVENRHLMTGDAEEDESVKPPPSSSHEKHHPRECDKNPTGSPKPDEPKDHKPVFSKISPKPEEAQPETTGAPNEKALKKPDKILPCPRCNSMDTKFCYFNNYNVNQPRHFCKNCQRYWTAGGNMRNVPVGAGRRKNKSSSITAAAHFRHLAVPPEILVFGGPDSPLCDSIASSLNITDQTGRSGLRNGLIRPEPNFRVPPPPLPPPPPPQAPCYPRVTQWAYHPWGPVGWTPPGGFFPMPFYPTAPPSYWGWSVPCVVPTVGPGPIDSGSNSPTLGKHSREGETAVATKESDPKKCLWVPRTSRIDDPSEAAKSSIWAMLGLQNEGGPDSVKGGIFKAFGTESRGDGKVHVPEASTVLQANPAALSRALSFHESS